MCGETRIPRDMCVGNTKLGETRITVTPVANGSIGVYEGDYPLLL